MTEPSDPSPADRPDEPDALDELASAYLDGEATAAEAARVESDPGLQARVAALRAVAEAVGAPPPAPPGAADAAVARAVAVGDEVFGPATVASLKHHRDRRQPRRTALWVATAAAAVALVAIGVPLLGQRSSPEEDAAGGDDAETAAELAEEPLAGEGDAGGSPTSAPLASTTVPGDAAFDSADDVIFLGDFASEDDLVEAVRQRSAEPRVESEEGGAPQVEPSASPCPGQVGDLTDVVAVYAASVDGEPFNAIVYLESPDEQAVVVVSADCDEIIRSDI
jgi:hypothetical protein